MEYRRIASETPGVLSNRWPTIEAIVAAFAARDADAAEKAMMQHMTNVHLSTIERMESRQG